MRIKVKVCPVNDKIKNNVTAVLIEIMKRFPCKIMQLWFYGLNEDFQDNAWKCY